MYATTRTTAAIGYGHDVSIRVEVWQGDEQIGLVPSDQLLGGSVTDQWVTGVRRTLEMTVEPTAQWREWLRIGVEIRPFRGVRFGAEDVEDCPLGCFPVRKFTNPLGSKSALPVRAQDRWQRIAANPFGYPIQAYPGLVVDVVARLIAEVDPYQRAPQVTATSQATTPAVRWDKTRVDTIADLLTAIGAEAFYDRTGRAVIQDLPALGSPVATIKAGRGGTVLDLTEDIDWETVVNSVGVYSTATNITLDPVWIGVWDSTSPAHRSNIAGGGTGGWQTARISSALFTDRQQMVDAANALLRKASAPARQATATLIPHPGLDAADTVRIQTDPAQTLDADMELAQIKQITHPLSGKATQQVTAILNAAAVV